MTVLRQLLALKPSGISHNETVKVVAVVLDVAAGRKTSVAKVPIDKLIPGGHLTFNEGVIKLP